MARHYLDHQIPGARRAVWPCAARRAAGVVGHSRTSRRGRRGQLGLDLLTAPHARGRPGSALVIDITGTASVDGAGLRAVWRDAGELGVPFCLAGPSWQARRLLTDIAGRIRVFTRVVAVLMASSPPPGGTGAPRSVLASAVGAGRT